MKKNKLFILILLCICLSGCSATYDVEIVNKTVKEKFSILNYDSSTWESTIDDQVKISEGDLTKESEKLTYKQTIDKNLKEKTIALLDTENYYNKKKISNNNELGIKYLYNFSVKNYTNSSIAHHCYKFFNFLDDDNKYVISTSKGFSCFNYSGLDDVTIHLKTNHKVIKSNADEVEENDYYWYINETNADDSSIYVELYKDKYVFNYNNIILKVVIVILSVAISGFIVIIILRKKAKKSNRI